MPDTSLSHLGARLQLSSDELATLRTYNFDAEAFNYLQTELQAGRFEMQRNQVQDAIEPTRTADLSPWPVDQEANACAQAGHSAIAAGQVAVAILNGGMATRFGGRVKGVVEVLDAHSFLAIKLRAIAAHTRVPIFIMNSFATDAATRAHLAEHDYFGIPQDRVHFVMQHISLRLEPAGGLFRDHHGAVSYYAPGHGDLLAALRSSDAFSRFVRAGGRAVCVSNVDNLGATLEPKVVGSHLRSKLPLTTEVASREGGDTGGAPVRRGTKIEVLEGFRFPDTFDTELLTAFNTNSFVIGTEALTQPYPLTWFRANKKVDGKAVVQFERLLGELTSFVPSSYLLVPREGPEGRFMPVKTPQDVDRVQPLIRARFGL